MKATKRQSFKTKAVLSSAAITALGMAAGGASGQTIQAITTWDLSNFANGTTLTNSPAPSFGTGLATPLGMTNNYSYSNGVTGSVTAADVTPQAGDPVAPNGLCWRVRGQNPGNGWNLAAPQYTQGAQFDASTVGHSDIVFSFDWFTTTQGILDLQEQYTTDGSTWNNVNGLQLAAANGWVIGTTIDFKALGIHGVDNNANFGVRLVSAYDPALGTYEAATGGGTVYNNNSGNWRFQDINIGFSSTNVAAVAPTLSYNPPGSTWVSNGTTAATMNWKDSNGASTSFVSGTNYSAAFTDSALVNGTASVSVSTNGIGLVSMLVSHTNGTYTFSGGPIGGGPLVKTGNGTLVLSSPNNFTKVDINGGTLKVPNDLSIGNNTAKLTLNGGTLQFTGTSAVTMSRNLTAGSNGATFDSGTNSVTLAGNVSLIGPFKKLGTGNLIFPTSGLSSFDGTGAFTLAAGNLIFSATSGVSTLVGPATPAGFNGNLIVTGKSRLNFNGGMIDGTGDIEIQTSGGGIGGDSSTATPTHTFINVPVRLNSLNKTGPFVSVLGMNGTFNTQEINGVISGNSDASWDGGKARVTVNTPATYTGKTLINNGDVGIIALGTNNALPSTDLQFGNGSNNTNVGVLDLNGHDQTIASLTADGVSLPFLIIAPGQKAGGIANTQAALSTLHINGTSTTSFGSTLGTPVFTTINGGAPANNLALQLDASHTGKLTLNGPNNFAGGIIINGGTLQIDPNIFISGTNNAGENSSSLPNFSDIVNNAGLIVNAAGENSQNATLAGNIGGSGTTTVTGGVPTAANPYVSTLVVNSIVQGSLVNHGLTTINTSGNIGAVSGTGSLSIGNAALGGPALVTVGSFSQNNVTINDQSKLTVAVTSPHVTNTVNALNFAGSSTLDVGNSSVVVNYGSAASPAAALQALIVSGRNGGTWNGTGVTSSTIAGQPNTAIGFIDGSDPLQGNTALPGTFKFGYALQGDTTLKGSVSLADYNTLAGNYKKTGQSWSQGDFTYDGQVTLADYNALAANFKKNVAPAAHGAVLAAASLSGRMNPALSAPAAVAADPAPTPTFVDPGTGKVALEADPTTGKIYIVGHDSKIISYEVDSASGKLTNTSGRGSTPGFSTLASQSQSPTGISGSSLGASEPFWNVISQATGSFVSEGVTLGQTPSYDQIGTGLKAFDLNVSGLSAWTAGTPVSDLSFSYGDGTTTLSPAVISLVPEPTTLSLLGLGAIGLLARRRKQICC
jgi:autotransporter-associated beta strand protein